MLASRNLGGKLFVNGKRLPTWREVKWTARDIRRIHGPERSIKQCVADAYGQMLDDLNPRDFWSR